MENNYYNDNETSKWLRYLMATGRIPRGRIDNRSIKQVNHSDIRPYTQVHLFAGVGGWPFALDLAGWPVDVPVWTGSCPCQPFSVAGGQKGGNDDRHLWPYFRQLVEQCEPTIIFGEQVTGKLGRLWLDGVRVDLENMGYAFGATDLPAAGVDAPHIRQRLFWGACRLGNAGSIRQLSYVPFNGIRECLFPGICETVPESTDDTENGRLGNADGKRRKTENALLRAGAWDNYEIVPCADGKYRRVESGAFPLVNGFPGRVELLRGYGNAIVPQLAAIFIKSFMEALEAL